MPLLNGVTGSKGYAGISLRIPDEEPEYKGTTMVFAQATAPIGWTQVNVNDLTLRITSGSTLNDGGSNPFSSTYSSSFPAQTGEWLFDSGTNYTTVAQMPPHLHYGRNSASVGTATTHALGPTLGSRLNPVHIPGGTITPNAPGPTSHNVLPYQSPLYSPTNLNAPGEGHSHGVFSGGIRLTASTTVDFRIKYIYAIIASRN